MMYGSLQLANSELYEAGLPAIIISSQIITSGHRYDTENTTLFTEPYARL